MYWTVGDGQGRMRLLVYFVRKKGGDIPETTRATRQKRAKRSRRRLLKAFMEPRRVSKGRGGAGGRHPTTVTSSSVYEAGTPPWKEDGHGTGNTLRGIKMRQVSVTNVRRVLFLSPHVSCSLCRTGRRRPSAGGQFVPFRIPSSSETESPPSARIHFGCIIGDSF